MLDQLVHGWLMASIGRRRPRGVFARARVVLGPHTAANVRPPRWVGPSAPPWRTFATLAAVCPTCGGSVGGCASGHPAQAAPHQILLTYAKSGRNDSIALWVKSMSCFNSGMTASPWPAPA